MNLASIFGKEKNIVIGAVHLPPSPGYPDSPGLGVAIENALRDAEALVEGGVDGIIFENNYDVPHTATVSAEARSTMIAVGQELVKRVRIPMGVSVLWNDYRTALTIAKALSLSFVRVPVFVDDVETEYGPMHGDAADVIAYRDGIGASSVALFTDIHVKHAQLVKPEPITAAALRAIEAGADALIVTGQWTGDAPNMAELEEARAAVGDFPILCGSGVTKENIQSLFAVANGAIVSTALKEEGSAHRANVKGYEARISREKTVALTSALLE
jgi:membrane complex biogenesis BtpA family protein